MPVAHYENIDSGNVPAMQITQPAEQTNFVCIK